MVMIAGQVQTKWMRVRNWQRKFVHLDIFEAVGFQKRYSQLLHCIVVLYQFLSKRGFNQIISGFLYIFTKC